MDAPQITLEQDYLTADVGPDMTIADLKGYIESETNIPGASQRVFHQERELANDSMTLQQCQVGNDSMLGMLVRNSQHSSLGSSRHVQGQRGAQAQAGARSGAQSQNVVNDPEIIRLQAMGDPNILARIRATNPELADAVQDPVRFRQVMQELERQRNEMEIERQRRQDLLAADPFNVDAQREIEEMIREQQVMENMQNAMEHNPEGNLANFCSASRNRSILTS